MSATITVYYNHFKPISALMLGRAQKIVEKVAYDARDLSLQSMSEPKSGRMYRVSATGKLHQASAPGEPPAIDTGTLANSHWVEVPVSEPTAYIHVSTEYAEVLEFGGAKMAARPYLRPALEKVRPSFEAACTALFDLPDNAGTILSASSSWSPTSSPFTGESVPPTFEPLGGGR